MAPSSERIRFGRLVGWLATLGAPVTVWAILGALHREVIPPSVLTLTRAEFLASGSAEPPQEEGGWSERALPDDWRRSRPGAVEGWYRIPLELDRLDDDRAAVYLPSVIMNAAVFLNGERLGDGGRFEDPVSRNWSRPLYFPFDATLLRAGSNWLYVRVKGDRRNDGLLGRVHVGAERDLAPIFAWSNGIEVTAVWVICVCQVVIALGTAALWWLRPRESYYGWFALTVFAWVAAELNMLVTTIPIPLAAWYWLLYASIGWWGIFAVLLLLSFIGDLTARTRRRFLLFGVIGSVLLAVLAAGDVERFHLVASLGWLTACALVAGYTAAYRVVEALRRDPDNPDLKVASAAAITVIGAVFFDLAMQVGLRPRGGVVYPPYTAPFVVAAMGWLLARRYLLALQRSEALAAGLEEDVHRKTAEVERSLSEMRAIDGTRVLAEERERIMRDMQDGIGSTLVTALANVEATTDHREIVDRSVRSALDDLRLMIDSLDPAEGNLIVALANLRARFQPRFDAAGQRVEWRVEDVPAVPDFGPHKALQVLRILQGVLGGALAQPPGSIVRVRTGTEPEGAGTAVFIAVECEGSSAPVAAPERDRDGTEDRRARDAGARVTWRRTERGATFRLSLPLGGAR